MEREGWGREEYRKKKRQRKMGTMMIAVSRLTLLTRPPSRKPAYAAASLQIVRRFISAGKTQKKGMCACARARVHVCACVGGCVCVCVCVRMFVCGRMIAAATAGKKQQLQRLELPISAAVLAVGLSPDPNLDVMSRLWRQHQPAKLLFLPWAQGLSRIVS